MICVEDIDLIIILCVSATFKQFFFPYVETGFSVHLYMSHTSRKIIERCAVYIPIRICKYARSQLYTPRLLKFYAKKNTSHPSLYYIQVARIINNNNVF